MGCLIGLDFGIKDSGIAITDQNQIIASPLDTCKTNRLISFLIKFPITDQDIDLVFRE